MDYEQDYSKTAWADSIWYYLSGQFRRNFAFRSMAEAAGESASEISPSGDTPALDCEDFN